MPRTNPISHREYGDMSKSVDEYREKCKRVVSDDFLKKMEDPTRQKVIQYIIRLEEMPPEERKNADALFILKNILTNPL